MQTVLIDLPREAQTGVDPESAGALRQGVNAGRQARFQRVVPPHLEAAHALARSLTRNNCDSEDIVQEACLRAFRGIAQFGGSNARAWVLTIVRHTAYDWIRKRRRAPQTVEDFEDHSDQLVCDEDWAAPESQLVSSQDARQLDRALRSLPAVFRKTLLLRYRLGLTYGEIATATGVPAGTVMSRLCRARRQLAALVMKTEVV